MAAPKGRGWRWRSLGDMRHRVTIQRPDETARDEFGAVQPIWIDVATVWAQIDPVSAREMMASGQVQGQATHRVVIRHRGDVSSKSRLIWVNGGNRVLSVVAAMPSVGAPGALELLCVCEETAT